MHSVLITGAGTGLGASLAEKYAQQGFHIILMGRHEKTLQQTKMTIENQGGKATTVRLDVRDREQVEKKLPTIFEHHTIQTIVLSAGVGYFGPFKQLDPKEFNRMMDTNVAGLVNIIQVSLPFTEKQDSATYLGIISTAGLRGKKNEAVYCASKFAARGLMESLAAEYEDTSIRFVRAYMGGMDTPFWEESDHIKDKSRLRPADVVADAILEKVDKDEHIEV